MKNLYKVMIPALVLGMSAPAVAQQFHVPARTGESVIKNRNGVVTSMAKTMKKADSNQPSRIIGWGGDAINEVDKYGTLRLVMEEDFSKLVTGTEEEPDRNTVLTISPQSDEYEYPWWNFKPEFTHLPHWGVGGDSPAGVYSAGGCLYLEMTATPSGGVNQAHVNTTLLKLDEDGGTAVLEFRARTRNAGETYDYLYVEAAETNDMGPTWRNIEQPIVVQATSEWSTFRIMLRDCGPTTLFNIVGVGAGNFYIDDIKVYQLMPYLAYPETLGHSEYKGTSFVANWAPVEGAEKYLLSVYTQNAGTGAKKYLLEDQEVTDTKYTVTGALSGETYYYVVKAVKGDIVSFESFPVRVYDLEVPVMNPAEAIDGSNYHASWSEVPCADVYNYYAYAKRVAATDGEFVVTNEDFTGIKYADGTDTDFTKEDPWDQCYDTYYSAELNQQGWYGTNCCPYIGYIALDAFFFEMHGSQTGFISPELDLSKDGGKFVLQVDLAGDTSEFDGEDGNHYVYTTQGMGVLFNWNDAKGDYDQVETLYLYDKERRVTNDFQTFKFEFTKGTDRSVVGIFAHQSFDNLYLDNLKITQNYKSGESLMDPFMFHRFHGQWIEQDPTSMDVYVPGRVQDCDIYHQVCAFSRQADAYGQSYDDRQSKWSPIEYAMTSTSGVENVATDATEAAAEYYRIDGIRVAADRLTPGVYVKRQGQTTTKVVVK